jgi:hypothetical protein
VSEGEAPDAVPLDPPKRRKKKRTVAAEPIAIGPREFFPKFAKTFPDHPAVNDLVEAFEQGNYARVREGAQRLLEETKRAEKEPREGRGERARGDALPHPMPSSAEEREALRRAARDLLRRIEPDPLAVYMLVGSVVLLAFLSLWYWTHPHIPAP